MAYIVQAITTKFIGPSNTKGARIKAKAAAGSITVDYDHALGIEANHAAAAKALVERYGWRGVWFQGGMPDDCGFVFVSGERQDVNGCTFDCAFITEGRH